MAQKAMYPGIENSPETITIGGTAIDATSVHVADTTKLPAAPNYMVLGTTNCEIIFYPSDPVNGVYSGVTRGVNGTTPQYWPDGSIVARRFCAIDLNDVQDNIEELDARVSEGTPTALAEMTDVQISGPTDNQFLRHDGTKWVNETVTVPMTPHAETHATGDTDPIAPADIGAATAGHTHDYSGTYAPIEQGVPNGAAHDHAGGDGGTIFFNAIDEIEIGENPADDDFLRFNGVKWVNEHVPLGGGGGMPWFAANADLQAAVNTGYIVGGLGVRLIALPSSAEIGDTVAVAGGGTNLFVVEHPGGAGVLNIFGGEWGGGTTGVYMLQSATPSDVMVFVCQNATAPVKWVVESWTRAPWMGQDHLVDTAIVAPAVGQVLRYNGQWQNANLLATDLGDSLITSPVNGHILIYWNGKWTNYLHNLNNLMDVAISSPAIGQVVMYDGDAWVNATVAGAGTAVANVDPGPIADNQIAKAYGTTGTSIDYSNATIASAGTINLPAGQTYNIGGVPHSHEGAGASLLTDLNDVTITGAADDQYLRFNGSQWVNETVVPGQGATTLDGLNDVTIATPTANQLLQYNGNQWINAVVATGAVNLNGLNDVAIATPIDDQYLRFNGSQWVNESVAPGGGATNLDGLTDVQISTPADNQFLRYDTASGQWVNETVAVGGASALDDLDDVTITDVADNQYLRYDLASGQWVNETVSGGAGATTLDGLDDVNTAGQSTGAMLYKSSGDWVVLPPGAANTYLKSNGVAPPSWGAVTSTPAPHTHKTTTAPWAEFAPALHNHGDKLGRWNFHPQTWAAIRYQDALMQKDQKLRELAAWVIPEPILLKVGAINVKSNNVVNLVSDGVTDNSGKLATLLASGSVPAGSTLYFPPGTYAFASRVDINKAVNLVGETGTVIKYAIAGGGDGYGMWRFNFDGTEGNKIGPFTIYGLTFTGMVQQVTSMYMEMWYCHDIHVNYCKIEEGGYGGYRFGHSADVLVENSIFLDIFKTGYGYPCAALDTTGRMAVRHCWFTTTTPDDYSYDTGRGPRHCVLTISQHTSPYRPAEFTNELTIEDNYFQGAKESAVEAHQNFNGPAHIRRNVFHANNIGGSYRICQLGSEWLDNVFLKTNMGMRILNETGETTSPFRRKVDVIEGNFFECLGISIEVFKGNCAVRNNIAISNSNGYPFLTIDVRPDVYELTGNIYLTPSSNPGWYTSAWVPRVQANNYWYAGTIATLQPSRGVLAFCAFDRNGATVYGLKNIGPGTAGQTLTSGGTGEDPYWG